MTVYRIRVRLMRMVDGRDARKSAGGRVPIGRFKVRIRHGGREVAVGRLLGPRHPYEIIDAGIDTAGSRRIGGRGDNGLDRKRKMTLRTPRVPKSND